MELSHQKVKEYLSELTQEELGKIFSAVFSNANSLSNSAHLSRREILNNK